MTPGPDALAREAFAYPAASQSAPVAQPTGRATAAATPRAAAWPGRLIVMAADTTALIGAFIVAAFLSSRLDTSPARASLAWLCLPVCVAVFHRYGLHQARRVASLRHETTRVLHALAVCVALVPAVATLAGLQAPRPWLALMAASAVVLVLAERAGLRAWFAHARRQGHFLRTVAVAGAGAEAAALVAMLDTQPELGYQVVALVADEGASPAWADGLPVVDRHAKVAEQLRLLGATGVLIATTDVDPTTTNRLARRLVEAGIHVELSSSLMDIDAERLSVRSLGRFPVLYVEPVKRRGVPAVAKRAFDLLGAATGMLLTAPLWLVVAVAIKVGSRGPVLFRQERVGRRGRRFYVYKFRTMVIDAEDQLIDLREANEADGPLFKVRHDPRVTAVGRVLRKLSLDELPQLLNVLRGQMSLVGPRPALPREVTQWGPELFDRLRVQPGITGMWQVMGRSDSSFAEYQRWDLYYVDNWSLWRDLSILARTVPVVLSGEGAY